MTYNPKNCCHRDLTSIHLEVFSSDEKKRLSVARIISSSLLNPYSGLPISGGLYDPALGPFNRNAGTCFTCGKSYVGCSGHMGHIELCIEVYNRIFGEAIYQILRMSCVQDSCSKLQFPDETLEIIILQIKLIELGYNKEPQDLEIFKLTPESELDLGDYAELRRQKIAEYSDLVTKEPVKNFQNTKITEELLQSVRNAAIKNKKGKTCIHCRKQLKTFKYNHSRLFMTVLKEELQGGKDSNTKTATDPVLPSACRKFLTNIYQNNAEFLKHLFPVLKAKRENPIDVFFTDIILVTPPVCRPPQVVQRTTTHHQQTTSYINIIMCNENLRSVRSVIDGDHSEAQKQLMDTLTGKTLHEKMLHAWQELQSSVDQTWDIKMGRAEGCQGLKQVIEKKEGIIRMHMLGKRVNHAGRTVITPDPNINIDEIGIPEVFAKKLTYPVPVTEWNVEDVRKYVLNGPNEYPGANFIQNENNEYVMIHQNKAKREGIAKRLLVSKVPIIVHRHLINGDVLLLNRQPSLHRPSIMAHKIKVMKGEKTLRLHYSNCKSYNADFDGDEMNCHCPQNEVARSEAYNLVNVANQYLVPKDGTPLGGLIQDHVIAAFKMSLRGRFFNREDYQQLVFVGLSHINKYITFLPPSIVKPIKLWSGKQILSTIIINVIPSQCARINLNSKSKINASNWKNRKPHGHGGSQLKVDEMTELEVTIRQGEVMTGVLDKAHCGATPFGLIHSMHELYGGACSTQLLSSFSKMFTFFLQREGFTLGVHDILVVAKADKKRRKIIEKSRKIGNEVAASALKLPEDEYVSQSELAIKMEEEYGKNPHFRNDLDRRYKGRLGSYTNKIKDAALNGLLSKFPENNLQLMVESGAKGTTVNTMQISCSLGQIELEGKRPPLMISGKSLPSFTTFETSPKSGGFIDGRFLTGIAPQDFFFHCMAGREGLIDTAVKTSRSGYLQRCLIKHLEGLHIHYDMTVRDSDNSVVQFMYGEDGMDIAKAPFLKSQYLGFLDSNADAIVNEDIAEKLRNDPEDNENIKEHKKSLRRWFKKNSTSLKKRIQRIEGVTQAKCPDPIVSMYRPDNYFGAISEGLEKICGLYLKDNPSRKRKFSTVMSVKSMTSLAAPGEPVGLLAAQSIGEPSTQMTLNTFHFAGRGEMNVTLGIPRLQEILMRASKNLKTPYMDIPFKDPITTPEADRKADKFLLKLNRVTLANVLESIDITSYISIYPKRIKVCVFRFNFLPRELYRDEYCVKPKQIRKYVEQKFLKLMFKAIEKSAKKSKDRKRRKKPTDDDNDEDAESVNLGDDGDEEEAERKASRENDSENEEVNDEDDATASKWKKNNEDDYDYGEDSDAEDEDNNMEQDKSEEDIYLNIDLDEDTVLKESNDNYENAQEYIRNTYGNVKQYEFDQKDNLWCELTFDLPVTQENVDFSTLLREVASTAVISQMRNIKRAIRDDVKNAGAVHSKLKTDGVNITGMFKYYQMLDLNRLYTNDIHEVVRTYGIEAGARVIVKEIQNVFGVYGINVDPRHLLLIADYMTFNGTFQPLSRGGMKYSTSPLQQMSFEASIQYVQSATVFNRCDTLDSPASRIMVGKPCKGGTGSFSLNYKHDVSTVTN